MNGLNSSYGHKSILCSYVGFVDELTILGYLQHGWFYTDGFGAKDPLPRFWNRYVWSSNNLERIPQNRSKGRYIPIGAPFLYLIRQNKALLPLPGEGTIAFPIHSAENNSTSLARHQEYSSLLRGYEGGPVTVCLYLHDFQNEAVRQAYQEEGHNIVTVGTSRHNRYYIPSFLRLLDHKNRVVSSLVSTSTIYAAALGLETEIYGPPLSENVQDLETFYESNKFTSEIDNKKLVTQEWALSELGIHNLLSPANLARTLGWTGWKIYLGAAIRHFQTMRRSAKKQYTPESS